jgi:hypothetical protein
MVKNTDNNLKKKKKKILDQEKIDIKKNKKKTSSTKENEIKKINKIKNKSKSNKQEPSKIKKTPSEKKSIFAILIDMILNLFKSKPKKNKNVSTKTDNTKINKSKKLEEESEIENDILDDLFAKYEEEDVVDEEKTKKKLNSKDKKNQQNNKGDDENEDEESEDDDDEDDANNKNTIKEKFLEKDGIKKPKSLKEIQEEAKKKINDRGEQKFTDSKAAKGDIKKSEVGHSKLVKKKTLSALDPKVFLIRGKDNGRPAWHYVLIPHENIKKLKVQKAGTNIDVTDFGKIIRSGWGENPSDEIIQEVEAEYGETQ